MDAEELSSNCKRPKKALASFSEPNLLSCKPKRVARSFSETSVLNSAPLWMKYMKQFDIDEAAGIQVNNPCWKMHDGKRFDPNQPSTSKEAAEKLMYENEDEQPMECSFFVFKPDTKDRGKGRMTTAMIRQQLADFGLNIEGNLNCLKKRLRYVVQCQRLALANLPYGIDFIRYDYIIAMSFGYNYDEFNDQFPKEVIEFTAAVVSVRQMKTVKMFHELCKPVFQPMLTEVTKRETSVTQWQVDRARIFPDVLNQFQYMLHVWGLEQNSFCLMTEGVWNIVYFLKQMRMSLVEPPPWTHEWIDVGKAFSAFYEADPMSLMEMLEYVGVKTEIDPPQTVYDVYHMGKLGLQMILDGYIMDPNWFLSQCPEVMYHSMEDVMSTVCGASMMGSGDDAYDRQNNAACSYPQPSTSGLQRLRSSPIAGTSRDFFHVDMDDDFPLTPVSLDTLDEFSFTSPPLNYNGRRASPIALGSADGSIDDVSLGSPTPPFQMVSTDRPQEPGC